MVNVEQYSQGTTFTNKLSVVCFPGEQNDLSKANIFNLNEVIYKRYYQKPFFQMIAIMPITAKNDFEKVKEQLDLYTNLKNWHFVFISEDTIKKIYDSFKAPGALDKNSQSPNAYIIDRKLRLRGRKDDEDTEDGKLYGYNMKSVAVLKNKMKDDIDIIYYQYKKSAEKEKRNKNNH